MAGTIVWKGPDRAELRVFRGRLFTKTVCTDKKKVADKALRDYIAEIESGRLANDPDHLTVATWSARWLDMIGSEVERRTVERYESVVRLRIIPALGPLEIAKLRPLDVQGFYSSLASSGLAARTVKQCARVFVTMINRAVKLELIASSPAARVDLPKVKGAIGENMVTLDQDESRALIEATKPTSLYLPVLLGLSGGLRRGEILAVRWTSIDFKAGTLAVDSALEQIGKTIRSKAPKSGKGRTITLPAPVIAELRRLKIEQAEALLALGHRTGDDTPICMRADGAVMTPRDLSERFRVFIRRSGLKVCRFHDLRHTHATELLRLGVPLKAVSERLGHADAALTLRIYCHATEADDIKAAALIAGIFKL